MMHNIMVQIGRIVNNASKTQLAMLAPTLVGPSGHGSGGQPGKSQDLVDECFSPAVDILADPAVRRISLSSGEY